MLGFCVLLKDTHLVESNRESGYGRFDLALLPVNEKYYGVILEFKRADDEAHLEAKALEALAQIDELSNKIQVFCSSRYLCVYLLFFLYNLW